MFTVRADHTGVLVYPAINTALLWFSNVKVHNFRARLDAFIAMYNGKLKFDNVEFDHCETAKFGIPAQDAHYPLIGFIVGGAVLTSETNSGQY